MVEPLRVFLEYPLMMYRWDDTSIPPSHPSRWVIVNNEQEAEVFRQQGYRYQVYKQDEHFSQCSCVCGQRKYRPLTSEEKRKHKRQDLHFGSRLAVRCNCCDDKQCGVHYAPIP